MQQANAEAVRFREKEQPLLRLGAKVFKERKAGRNWRAANINNRLTHGCFDVDKGARAMRIFIIIGAHQTAMALELAVV